MDSSSLVVDQQALYNRRGSNTHGPFYPSTPRPESMTLQQQQQLLNLLNAHAAGAGASGLGFLGARGNGAAAGQAPQQQQHVPPPPSYAAVPLIGAPHVPSHPSPPPRPAYSSMPTPRLLHHQHSNPPLLPLPFSRSASLPPQVPAPRPHVNGPPRKPGGVVAAPRASIGPKEQQKSTRPSKQATCGGPAAAVIRPKKEVRSAEGSNKVETAAKPPNVPVAAASDNKLQEASTTPAAPAAAKEKKPDARQASEVVTGAGSTGFSVYSLAPHPSSLPLPRLISLRPKAIPVPASCNAEALGGRADGASRRPRCCGRRPSPPTPPLNSSTERGVVDLCPLIYD